jgi:hypothetical protein
MPRPQTIQLWRQRLERFDPATMTVAQFCHREGVSQPSFYKWKKTLQQLGPLPNSPAPSPQGTQPAVRFLPLSLVDPPPHSIDSTDQRCSSRAVMPPTASTTIELPGGVRIVVEVQS